MRGLVALLLLGQTLYAQNNFFALRGLVPVQWQTRKEITHTGSHWFISTSFRKDSVGPYSAIILKLPDYPDRLIKAVSWESPNEIRVLELQATSDNSLMWFLMVQDTFVFAKLDTGLNIIWSWRFVLDSPFTVKGWHIEDDSVAWLYGYSQYKSRVRLIKVNFYKKQIGKWKVNTSFSPYDVAVSGLRGYLFLLNADEPQEDSYIFVTPIDNFKYTSFTISGFGVSLNVVGTSGAPFFRLYPIKYVDDMVALGGEIKGAGIAASDAVVGVFRYPSPMVYLYSFGSAMRSDRFCGFASVYPSYNVATALSIKKNGRNFSIVLSGDLRTKTRNFSFDNIFTYGYWCNIDANERGILIASRFDTSYYGTYELRWAYIFANPDSNWQCRDFLNNDATLSMGPADTVFTFSESSQIQELPSPALTFQDTLFPYQKQELSNVYVSSLCATTGVEIISTQYNTTTEGQWSVKELKLCRDKIIAYVQCNNECNSNPILIRVLNLNGQTVKSYSANISRGINIITLPIPPYLPSGIYIVSFANSHGSYTAKFMLLDR